MALESIALCVTGFMGVGTVYLNGRSRAFAVIIIGTVVGFAVNLDFFAAASIRKAVCHRIFRAFLKTATACLVCRSGIFTDNINTAFGTEFFFVVNTFDC